MSQIVSAHAIRRDLEAPPEYGHLEFRASDFHYLEGGRIVQSWHVEDYFGLLEQIGATVTTQR